MRLEVSQRPPPCASLRRTGPRGAVTLSRRLGAGARAGERVTGRNAAELMRDDSLGSGRKGGHVQGISSSAKAVIVRLVCRS